MTKIKLFTILLVILFCGSIFASEWDVKTYPSNNCVTYHQVISFTAAGDSLYRFVLSPIPAASFDSATISIKTSGTTVNYRVSSYLTNFNEPADSTYWTIIKNYDTTTASMGSSKHKPSNAKLDTKTTAGSFAYNILVVTGLAGNTLNSSLDIAVTYYRKE